MSRANLYRSLCIGGLVFSACFAGGCEQNKFPTQKATMTAKWNDTRVAVMYQVAQQQYAVGDYDKCRQTLGEALSIQPDQAKLLTLAAKVELEKGSLDAAANDLRKSLMLQPSDPEPSYLLGVVYQRWQKFDQACDYYQQAWDHKPAEALYMLAVVEMKMTLGHLDEARQILQDRSDTFEQTAAVHVALARIASLQNDFVTASKCYRDAIVLQPDDQNLQRSYAEALFYSGKYSAAVPLLENIRQKIEEAARQPATADAASPPADIEPVLLMLGQSYLNLHRVQDAKVCYQIITQDHPDDMQALIGLGKVAVESNDLSSAGAAARKILAREPQKFEGLILLAVVQQKQKKWDEALVTLGKAAKVEPKDSTVLCMQGVAVQQMGRQTEAVGYFEQAVAANPQDSWATELLGRAKPASLPTLPSQDQTTTSMSDQEQPPVITDAAQTPAPGSNAP